MGVVLVIESSDVQSSVLDVVCHEDVTYLLTVCCGRLSLMRPTRSLNVDRSTLRDLRCCPAYIVSFAMREMDLVVQEWMNVALVLDLLAQSASFHSWDSPKEAVLTSWSVAA